MALPKPVRPEHSTTVPSTGKKIKYQPFTVKEEKILILAAEGQGIDEISNAISNVLTNCISSPADFKVDDLALFDIEYLFLKCRAKSVGETVSVRITDPQDENYTITKDINVDSIKVEKNKAHTDLIDINDEIKVKMRYPGLEFFAEGLKVDNISESMETVAKCISSIVIEEEVYARGDMTEDEIVDWLEALTSAQFSKIMEFFQTMPKLRHTVKCTNKNTGNDFSVVLEGLADFF